MISHACPVIVLDDNRDELMQVSYGLGVSGLPVMSHLIAAGDLERTPEQPYSGIRLFVTDLHILGPDQAKPEQYTAALIRFIERLVLPTTYLVVFWSNFADEAKDAWNLLSTRIKPTVKPFGYAVLSKTDAAAAANGDEEAIKRIQAAVSNIIKKYPQLQAVMEWEASVSRSAAETTNELVRTLARGGIAFEQQDDVKSVMARMAQEALGYPHAPKAPTKGITQALLPITQEWLDREARNGYLNQFLSIDNAAKIPLPSPQTLTPLLNDFFVYSSGDAIGSLDRGAVIRLGENYLVHEQAGLSRDVGLSKTAGDWRGAICHEFAHGWIDKDEATRQQVQQSLEARNVYAIELSADCDHAQDKPRAHRFLLALFEPSKPSSQFYSKSKGGANDSIYVTPEITIEGISGRLLVSCRVFFTRPHGVAPDGTPVLRLRKDVIDEISHLYATQMRRPGKIAFY